MKLILSSCDFRNEKSRDVILTNLPKPIEQCRLLFIPNEKATFEAIRNKTEKGELLCVRRFKF